MDPEQRESNGPYGPPDGEPAFQGALYLRRQGESLRADAVCAGVLQTDPNHFDAYHLRGLIALENGEMDRGIGFIERSLAINPNQALAHSNLGNALLSVDQPQRALESLDRALRLKSDLVIAHYNRGNALRSLGRVDEALASYEAALRLDGFHAKTLNNQGLVLQEAGRREEALSSFIRAWNVDPSFIAPQKNIAALLLMLERPLEALAVSERLLEGKQGDPEVHCGCGDALLALGRLEEAVECYSKALQFDAEYVEALMNRSAALQRLKRLEPALADCERALQFRPESVLALCNCGNILLGLERAQAGLACYERALELSPEDCSALYGRAAALLKLGRLEEAARAFADLLRVQPDHHAALGNLFSLRMEQCDWHDFEDLSARAFESLRRTKRFVNPLLLLVHDDSEVGLDCARGFVDERFPTELSLGPLPPPSGCDPGRTRVAYVSADFTDHPVSHLLVGVLERHNREQFEVIGVLLRARGSGSLEQRVLGAFDRYIDASQMSERETAGLMREWGVDIAVDLMGFTEGSRLGIFAHRAARVQANYLGYAGSTGAPYMDYVMADAVVIPPGCDRWYSEQVIRLPDCYLPTDDRRIVGAPPTRTQAGLPRQGFVFCAFTKAHKITPRVFEIWMRLLRRTETQSSVLWLRDMGSAVRAKLMWEAEKAGVGGDRLVFAPPVAGTGEHLGRLALADLYLDTRPYNAHSTACDALWAGVPVLTCTASGFAGRVAASALAAVGLPELITHSLEEYERCALDLARQPGRLHALRSRLALQRTRSPLFDTTRYTRQLETAFKRMHLRALRGEPAASFSVEPAPGRS
jgi:protein O-GlcNAc transferase